MNKTIIVAGMLSFAALLSGAENLMKKPEVSYKVFPGRWNSELLKSKNETRNLKNKSSNFKK